MQQSSSGFGSIDAADLAFCRNLLAGGSRTFLAASHLLPSRVRDPATALYAFCRVADDAIDHGDPDELDATLAALRSRIARAYDGRPHDDPVDRAFAATAHAHGIPAALPLALIEGFEWDALGRRYETLEDVVAYGVRVAGAVGMMMALLMGARDHQRLSRACDLGVAMQLTNIARDVGEDARADRIYLPLSWLREAGLDVSEWMQAPHPHPVVNRAVERLLAAADEFYRRGEIGIAALPADCRPGILAAGRLYAEIGREVERAGLDSVTRRAHTSMSRKLTVLGGVARDFARLERHGSYETIASARYLFDDMTFEQTPAPATEAMAPWWDLGARLTRVVDIFERLEQRDRMAKRATRAGDSELSSQAASA